MTIVEQLKPEVYKRGIEKGIQQGIEKGIEKGKLEAFKAITLALNLFKEGKSVTQIAEATELSLLELEDLKKQVH